MKKLFILILTFMVFSCNQQSEKNVQTPEGIVSQDGFDSFKDLFTTEELPFSIDTLFIVGLQKSSQSRSAIDSAKLDMVTLQVANELYEGRLKYRFYPTVKFKFEDSWGLLYYGKLNPEIPFDATVSKVWLGVYSEDGVLSDSKEVGLIDLQYGIEKRIFSTISSNMIEQNIIDSQEDFDTGKISIESTTTEFTLSQGVIK